MFEKLTQKVRLPAARFSRTVRRGDTGRDGRTDTRASTVGSSAVCSRGYGPKLGSEKKKKKKRSFQQVLFVRGSGRRRIRYSDRIRTRVIRDCCYDGAGHKRAPR